MLRRTTGNLAGHHDTLTRCQDQRRWPEGRSCDEGEYRHHWSQTDGSDAKFSPAEQQRKRDQEGRREAVPVEAPDSRVGERCQFQEHTWDIIRTDFVLLGIHVFLQGAGENRLVQNTYMGHMYNKYELLVALHIPCAA